MPIYEYCCSACGRRFTEYSRKVLAREDDAHPPCPDCQSTATCRTLGSFVVRGGGAADPVEAGQQNARHEREAQVTPREQIEAFRKKGRP